MDRQFAIIPQKAQSLVAPIGHISTRQRVSLDISNLKLIFAPS
jgi:hypothetical protein